MPQDLHTKVKNFPRSSGVYLMKDGAGHILYIGKATSLRDRVKSYFLKQASDRYQIKYLMAKVADIDFIVTDNAKEALLLENTYIKKYQPKYNFFLKDDKSYVSLALSVQHPFPRLHKTRKILKDGTLYFGPYSSAYASQSVVEFVGQHFRLRTCQDHDFANRSRPCLMYQIKKCDAPCVGYVSQTKYAEMIQQVKLFLYGRDQELKNNVKAQMFQAAEVENFEEAARLRDLLKDIERTLEKQKVVSHQDYDWDVLSYDRQQNQVVICIMMIRTGLLADTHFIPLKVYEPDEEFLSKVVVQYYGETKFIPPILLFSRLPADVGALADLLSERAGLKVQLRLPQKGEKLKMVQLAEKNAKTQLMQRQQRQSNVELILENLKQALHLKSLPRTIECYDISNFQGQDSVGSMVTFVEGEPYKQGYRRFKIKTVEQANDFAMLYEVLQRRIQNIIQHPSDSKWSLPDLMIMDGGKAQLNVALRLFKELNIINIDVVGLAKSRIKEKKGKKFKTQERVFLPNRLNPVVLATSELHLLQRIRDEAHRFGIIYHRKLRQQKGMRSRLEEIAQVGPKRMQKLLTTFGSVEGIQAAAPIELAKVARISLQLAKSIKEQL